MRNSGIPQVVNEQGQWLADLDRAVAPQNMSPDQGLDLAEEIEDLGALQMAASIREAARDAMRFRGYASPQQRPTGFAHVIDPQQTNPTPPQQPTNRPEGGRAPGLLSRLLRNAVSSKWAQALLFSRPIPSRVHAIRLLDKAFDVLPYEQKLLYNTVDRPYYGYGLLRAAELARHLGHRKISAVEFGVAGGNGLLCLERHALQVREVTGVEVDTYGFDSGRGMPAPQDYRDLPYLWQEGYFAMDWERLRGKVRASIMLLGPVEETVKQFLARGSVAPVGFIAFDLDYYTSTVAAFQIFDAEDRFLLPRVACYFDDIVGDFEYGYNEFTGELLAIQEFNAVRRNAKIAPVRGLRYWGNRTPELWHEQMFITHLFRHTDYNRPVNAITQLPLSSA